MAFPYQQMRAARQAKGMSMRQLGMMLDPPVKERTVHMWETGQYAPKSPRREQIYAILDLQISDFIDHTPPVVEPVTTGTIGMSRADLIATLLAMRSDIDAMLGKL